ncbi:hypothetical protein NEOLEDRAFT_1136139 [Neolentinus lepideus HHB14362 ss-1]|uniref:Uncharacterized protein n=1 Tax=Neolentinus lepideus HHB14362 ss-1 TaxID=1314782 RepID=A0A165RDH4_9AGAM|nr:hypothetical protein NEOLEDRAFT_1136139 [Neolentinus lepideus HHB14362 ss-1]
MHLRCMYLSEKHVSPDDTTENLHIVDTKYAAISAFHCDFTDLRYQHWKCFDHPY